MIDQVTKGKLTVKHLPGEYMLADGLTKPLVADRHVKFVKLMGMVVKEVP